MKNAINLMIVLAVSAAPLWAVENPNVRSSISSPAGAPTAVPSAGRSGLVPSRPFDTAGRDNIVTGHVGGMAHFRGAVPYSSGYYYGSAATSPVDNFLRRSYDPIASDRSPGQFRSYYDPRRTVASTTQPGGTGLFTPMITSQGQSDPYTPPMLAQTVGTQYRPRPLSLSGAELERVLERQMQVREETDPSRRVPSTEQVMAREERLTESLFFKDYLLPEELKDREQIARERTDTPDTEQPEADLKPEERIRDEFIEELEEQLRQEGSERIAELLRERPELSDSQAQEAQQPPVTGGRPSDAAIDGEQDEPILTEEQQAEAAALLSQYKTFERLAAARAAQYLTAAERFLKEGKFYKAADAFALAAVWTPRDARPYAGQAFALFAAGEYVSSSYHLRRAIVRNPMVASEKVDLAQLIGDRDVFENRLVEMTNWQQRSESGELAFMMAFVLHHDDKPQRAAEAIGQALEKMPDDQAVQILHQAITGGQASQD